MRSGGAERAHDALRWRSAARAAGRTDFMAGLLAAYQEIQNIGEADLAEELGCPIDTLSLLGLCRAPRRDAANFGADLRAIAGYVGIQPGRLATVVRTVDTMRALRRSGAREAGYLTAARDDEETDAPIKEDRTSPLGAFDGAGERGEAAPPTAENEAAQSSTASAGEHGHASDGASTPARLATDDETREWDGEPRGELGRERG